MEHIDCVPLSDPGTGIADTVTVLIAVVSEQPPVPVTLYVIVVVPADTGETNPVDEVIVATPILPEVHVPPEIVELNDVMPLEQIACVPFSVPGEGLAVIVTVLVAVVSEHPPVPATL